MTQTLILMLLALLTAFVPAHAQELVFKKYTQLPAATVLQATDIFPVVVDVNSAPVTSKASVSQVATFLNGGALTYYLSRANHTGTQAWSTLTGTPTTLSGYGITDGQPLDADLTSIAGLITTSFGRGLLTESDASSLRTTLSLVPGTHVQVFDADLTSIAALATTGFGRGLLTETNAASMQTTLSLVPGTNVQAFDADLANIAALSTSSYGRSLLTLADAAALRTAAGLVIGTDVQGYNAALDTFGANGSAFYLARGNHTGTQAWSTLTGTPTTLGGYGITDAQPLNSTLSDIAALETDPYGVGLLTQTNSAGASVYLGLQIGVNVQAFDADLSDLADGTLTGTKVQRQMSVDADGSGLKLYGDSSSPGNNKIYGTNGSGVKGWYDVPSGSGGSFVGVAYVHPHSSIGSDTTGDGSPENPYQTLQKAWDMGNRVVICGDGNVGNLNTTVGGTLSILGMGRGYTTVGTINVTGHAQDFTLQDLGPQTFTVTGTITLAGGTLGGSGGNAGALTLIGVYSPLQDAFCRGGDGPSAGAGAGHSGTIEAIGCVLNSVQAPGGTGGAGDGGSGGGGGGNGGVITLRDCKITGEVSAAPGVGGSDGGAGGGGDGTEGTYSVRFSDIGSMGVGGADVHASMVAGTWTD